MIFLYFQVQLSIILVLDLMSYGTSFSNARCVFERGMWRKCIIGVITSGANILPSLQPVREVMIIVVSNQAGMKNPS